MIKQIFNIKHYWTVIVYYNIDYDYFNIVRRELLNISTPVEEIDNIKYHLFYDAYGVTVNSLKHRCSVVAFNRHTSKAEYLSSIVHEAEHIKQGIFSYYNVPDKGEDAAYTIGYIVKQMFDAVSCVVFDKCN